MSILQSVLLGLLQGLAEFLPVSSSGHLALVHHLFGLENVPLLYDVFLHLATLIAVIVFFRKKIWKLLCIFFRWILRRPAPENEIPDSTDILAGTEKSGRKTILAIIAATFVTGVIGIFTGKVIGELSIKVTCALFLVTAFFLMLSGIIEKRRFSRAQKNINTESENEAEKGISFFQGLFIGFMQGLGTFPGISRSGSTIAGALISGVERTSAGEFSFILSIPAILGAFILEIKDLNTLQTTIGILPVITGSAAAFISGYFFLSCLMKLIKKGRLEWFAVYLIPLGIAGLLLF